MAEIVVLVTTASEDESARIAQKVVEERLSACANIIPSVRSIFQWEGKLGDERESLMLLKTQSHLFEHLSNRIKELHSYDVPEIIALPIELGARDYLAWVREMTGGPQGGSK